MASKLGEWLKSKPLTNKQFADLLAPHMGLETLSERTVELWRAGNTMPRKKALAAIATVTEGQITANDFVGESA